MQFKFLKMNFLYFNEPQKGYTTSEIIAIFIVSSLIVILSLMYFHQSSTEKTIKNLKEKVQIQAKNTLNIITSDLSKSKKGSMEITPYGKSGAKITFQYLENQTLMPLIYLFNKPKLIRSLKGKDTVICENISGLKINEDFNTGLMEIEVAVVINYNEQIISHSERGSCSMLDSVPENVQMISEEGIEITANDPTLAIGDASSSSTFDYFTEYVNTPVLDLKKRKYEIEYELERLAKKESEINSQLGSLSAGIKNTTFPLVLPNVKDNYILELASNRPAVDQKYVEIIKEKILIIDNQFKLKQEIKVIDNILKQKESNK